MPWNVIKINKAQCKHCGDILISTDEDKKETCTCGKLTVDGGSSFLTRTGERGTDYKELSELNFGDAPNVKDDTVHNTQEFSEIQKWQQVQEEKARRTGEKS